MLHTKGLAPESSESEVKVFFNIYASKQEPLGRAYLGP